MLSAEVLNDMDDKAKEIGLIIGIPNTIYCYTVSDYSIAYMELYNNQWFVWRETYQVGRRKSINYKIIAQSNTFDYALLQFKKYIDFLLKKS